MRLTDPEFIKRLEMLSILARRVLGGDSRSDRRSRKRGAGTTFADYSEYNFGDDYRNIDWNIYARMETLNIKLFELEEDVSVHVLLDLSRSMKSKLEYARMIAAAISYIALKKHDRLAVWGISDKLTSIVEPCRGRTKLMPMLRSLENTSLYGVDTDLSACIREFQVRLRKPGICVLISDFLCPGGFRQGIDCLKWSKNDVYCVQVMHPSELKCELRGDIELECMETSELRKLTIGPDEARRYAEAMAEWNLELKKHCAKNGASFIYTDTDRAFEDVIQDMLKNGGFLS